MATKSINKGIFMSLCMLIGIANIGECKILHVPTSKYPLIQVAINKAHNGDTIIVKDGIYKGLGNTNITLYGKAIKIQSQNGPNQTIIHCQNRSQGFIVKYGEKSTTIISGFKIIQAKGNFGGGIYCFNASPTITNMIIENNQAKVGAGIYCFKSNPVIYNCVMQNNIALQGGGIFCSYSSPQLTMSNIVDNRAQNEGGGMYCYRYSNPYIFDTLIANNIARMGGALFSKESSVPELVNSSITSNTAYIGGGMYCLDSHFPQMTYTQLINNTSDCDEDVFTLHANKMTHRLYVADNESNDISNSISKELATNIQIVNQTININPLLISE